MQGMIIYIFARIESLYARVYINDFEKNISLIYHMNNYLLP